nr:PREDICTED: ephrin-B2a-like [Latimeria chalumnae]|eukprot:XP_006009791.1 PREDICTED: ephrin-B2a-like [Latimeria chalumnae]
MLAATSDGTKEGLENMRGGACRLKGMKVILKVGQNPNGRSKPQKPNAEVPLNKEQAVSTSDPNLDPDKENSGAAGNSTGKGTGENGPLSQSNVPIIAGAAGGAAFLLIIATVIAVVCYRRRQSKHSDTHHPPLSLSTLTSPKRGGGGGGNNNGSEPSDIIIPLRTSDSAFCPHYEKVSGDYGHPVYIVQEMPPQSPANIYYKV